MIMTSTEFHRMLLLIMHESTSMMWNAAKQWSAIFLLFSLSFYLPNHVVLMGNETRDFSLGVFFLFLQIAFLPIFHITNYPNIHSHSLSFLLKRSWFCVTNNVQWQCESEIVHDENGYFLSNFGNLTRILMKTSNSKFIIKKFSIPIIQFDGFHCFQKYFKWICWLPKRYKRLNFITHHQSCSFVWIPTICELYILMSIVVKYFKLNIESFFVDEKQTFLLFKNLIKINLIKYLNSL